jgi:demethylmenaquinone methyltransferase/2-methoxy-6-polyprenyl-1,4-benzoquinol methylase
MLEVGTEKVTRSGLGDRVELEAGDAQALPYEDDSFDGCCIAFGIRNVPDRSAALAEMARVTKPAGRVAVLELGEPSVGWLSPVARRGRASTDTCSSRLRPSRRPTSSPSRCRLPV